MTLKNMLVAFALGSMALLSAGAGPGFAQESHIGNLTGHAESGKQLYRRYCVGCHGPDGDSNGENAQWIDPKPRDFTLATFKCRSTPTGTLPTDQDLYNAVERGFVTTNMPSWRPLTPQQRADLVAFIKTFSPDGKRTRQVRRSPFPPKRQSPSTAFSMAEYFSRRWNAGNAMVPQGMAMVPRQRR